MYNDKGDLGIILHSGMSPALVYGVRNNTSGYIAHTSSRTHVYTAHSHGYTAYRSVCVCVCVTPSSDTYVYGLYYTISLGIRSGYITTTTTTTATTG